MILKKAMLIAVGVLLALVVAEYVRWRIAGGHSTRIVISDDSASSAEVAIDLRAYSELLYARPSRSWSEYYEAFVYNQGLERVFSANAVNLSELHKYHLITELPNGTHGEELTRINLSARANAAQTYLVQAVKIRVRDGRYKGLEGWTLPSLVQREIAWP